MDKKLWLFRVEGKMKDFSRKAYWIEAETAADASERVIERDRALDIDTVTRMGEKMGSGIYVL